MKPKKLKTGDKLQMLRLGLTACAALGVLLFHAGCFIPAAGVMATPTKSERKSAAEYNLTKNKGQIILVLVEQPGYINAPPNMRYLLTDTINKMLEMQVKIPDSNLVNYDKLSDYRANNPDFSFLTPQQIGAALGADLVLVVDISECQIKELPEVGFYTGSMDVRAYMVKVATGEKIWPELSGSMLAQVGFESERRGQDAAMVRLAAAAAHCVTRYLYDCPESQFKIADERTTTTW